MTNELYRLVYVSRSNHTGDDRELEAEVDSILEVSQRNNQAAGITGALLFSSDGFAQMLEGGLADVTEAFERIQCDPRHRETIVLQAGSIAERDFSDWSMAYAGRVETDRMRFAQLDNEIERTDTADAILRLMRRVVARAEVTGWAAD